MTKGIFNYFCQSKISKPISKANKLRRGLKSMYEKI